MNGYDALKIETDVTRGTTEEVPSIENAPSGSDVEEKRIKYLTAGKYKIGFIEDFNLGVVGIHSIEILKSFLAPRYFLWVAE